MTTDSNDTPHVRRMQALGRCIRHKADYGAIILLDERLRDRKPQSSLSKWLRDNIAAPRSFDESRQRLNDFFRARQEEETAKAAAAALEPACGGGSILSRQIQSTEACGDGAAAGVGCCGGAGETVPAAAAAGGAQAWGAAQWMPRFELQSASTLGGRPGAGGAGASVKAGPGSVPEATLASWHPSTVAAGPHAAAATQAQQGAQGGPAEAEGLQTAGAPAMGVQGGGGGSVPGEAGLTQECTTTPGPPSVGSGGAQQSQLMYTVSSAGGRFGSQLDGGAARPGSGDAQATEAPPVLQLPPQGQGSHGLQHLPHGQQQALQNSQKQPVTAALLNRLSGAKTPPASTQPSALAGAVSVQPVGARVGCGGVAAPVTSGPDCGQPQAAQKFAAQGQQQQHPQPPQQQQQAGERSVAAAAAHGLAQTPVPGGAAAANDVIYWPTSDEEPDHVATKTDGGTKAEHVEKDAQGDKAGGGDVVDDDDDEYDWDVPDPPTFQHVVPRTPAAQQSAATQYLPAGVASAAPVAASPAFAAAVHAPVHPHAAASPLLAHAAGSVAAMSPFGQRGAVAQPQVRGQPSAQSGLADLVAEWIESDQRRFRAALQANLHATIPVDKHESQILVTIGQTMDAALQKTRAGALVPFLDEFQTVPIGLLFVVWCAEDGTFWHGSAGRRHRCAQTRQSCCRSKCVAWASAGAGRRQGVKRRRSLRRCRCCARSRW